MDGAKMIAVEKPGSPSEILEHVGVLGMKWGVHRTRGTHEFKAKNPTSAQRTVAIKSARSRQAVRKQAFKAEKRGSVKRTDLKKVYLNNPDRATALRLTRGQKVVRGFLYAAVPIPVIPAAVAISSIGRVGKRRASESRRGKG
jgi:hypothetical protein